MKGEDMDKNLKDKIDSIIDVTEKIRSSRFNCSLFDKAPKRKDSINATYKQIIGNALGIRWGNREYDVHHLNFDHNDNDIDNLLLIPRKLHNKYHLFLRMSDDCMSNMMTIDNTASFNASLFSTLYETKCDMRFILKIEQEAIKYKSKDPEFDSKEFLERNLYDIFMKYQ